MGMCLDSGFFNEQELSDLTVRESAPKELIHLPLPRRQQEPLVLECDRLPDGTCQIIVPDTLDELAKPSVRCGTKQDRKKLRARPIGRNEKVDGSGLERDPFKRHSPLDNVAHTIAERTRSVDGTCKDNVFYSGGAVAHGIDKLARFGRTTRTGKHKRTRAHRFAD